MDQNHTTQKLPRVSIGMPAYNGEKYIREALDSLLGQTFSDFELIISDNASNDGTEEICRKYAAMDSRIHYFRQVENKGAITNFQFVLDEASCEYFMWAAYDDTWTENYLMGAVTLLTDQSVDFVFPTFELRSIEWGCAKKFDHNIFKFIEVEDRRIRVLSFCNLHYLSLSVNIVYSLFRTQFLKKALSIQIIANEGVLGAVILSLGRGAINNGLFSKRYRRVWPGMAPSILRIFYGWLKGRNITDEALHAISAARINMIKLFPEYTRELNYIFNRYNPYKHDTYYKVCPINEVLKESHTK